MRLRVVDQVLIALGTIMLVIVVTMSAQPASPPPHQTLAPLHFARPGEATPDPGRCFCTPVPGAPAPEDLQP